MQERLNGPEIVRLREAQGMNQAELARAAGLKSPALCQYERSVRGKRVHPRTVNRIAAALTVKREAILIAVEEPTKATAEASADQDQAA
jgi:transcriptional regulator with XRE-family HTH domain